MHLTPKYFFRLNNSLHLFETHCAFLILRLFSPNLDFLQAVKVMKSGHYLLHDRASKGLWIYSELTSQTDLHRIKVHLNPRYFFRLNKSLHLFETHFAFLNLILTFL